MKNQTSILQSVTDSVSRFSTATNAAIRKNRVWLALATSEEKKHFKENLSETIGLADSFLKIYSNRSMEHFGSNDLKDLFQYVDMFYSRIKAEIESCDSLINETSKRMGIKDAEKDLALIGEFLDAATSAEEEIAKYLPELQSRITDYQPPQSENTGPYSGSSISENPGSTENTSRSGIKKEENIPTDDHVKKLLRIAVEFVDALNLFKKENYQWYSETESEADVELGNRMAVALYKAQAIIKNGDKYIKRDTDIQSLFIENTSGFYIALGDLLAQCKILAAYYPTVFSASVLSSSLDGLFKLERTVSPFFVGVEELALDLSIAKYMTPKTDHSVPSGTSFILTEDTLTSITSDVPRADDPDSLDIAPDVIALASVIAYKAMTPPLAIGLFGNWGSGKSFFMKKLRKQIDFFAQDDDQNYVDHVVHIEFNSWHYSDSNLWASFVMKIFEDLENYGKKNPKAVEELFRRLNSSSEFLNRAKTKQLEIEETIKALETELKQKNIEIRIKAQQLNGIKLTDVAFKVLNNPDVKYKLAEAKKQLPQRELNNLEDIYRSVKELDGFAKKFVETVKLLLSFKSWKSWAALAFFILTCASPFLLGIYFRDYISPLFSWFGKYSAPAAILFANLAGIASYATAGLSRVQENLKSIAGDCAQLENESLAQHQTEVAHLQSDLDLLKQTHALQEAEINKLNREHAEIAASISDIKSGKKLAGFIADRVTDQRYINSLGLISWIRKDFQKLDELLKEQREANQRLETTGPDNEEVFQVDRIVLYIDDLDRCSEEVVVKVLEAIHLLLAFELFVVVVGVDPRWMHNALENKYSRQLKKIRSKRREDNRAEGKSTLDAASSYDYLEKIFQVPFSLKEINPAGKWKLIDAQATNTVELKFSSAELKSKPDGDSSSLSLEYEVDKSGTTPGPQPVDKITSKQSQVQQEEILQNVITVNRAKEQLVISPDEIQFMKDISELIGSTPRTVNRYINIYHIIRSHRNLKKTETPLQDYCATMVLLGIVTGLPNESEEFFNNFIHQKQGTFGNLVEKTGTEFQALKDACNIPYNVSPSMQRTVGELPIEFMKQKFELVQRFSFRSYEVYEDLPASGPKPVNPSKKALVKNIDAQRNQVNNPKF